MGVLYHLLSVFSGWLTARASHCSLAWLILCCHECWCKSCILVLQHSVKCSEDIFFRLFLVLLPFCFLSGRLEGNIFPLAELSFQDIQQKLRLGHSKAMTLPGSQPLLDKHKAALVQTFCSDKSSCLHWLP